jgi:intein/homing endonuclease
VIRIDPQSSVVVLDDGRMYRVTPSTTFLVDNRPIQFTMLRPGERVTVQAGEPVVYREGRYVALQPVPAPPSVVTQAPVVTPPPVVTQAPVVAPPAVVAQTPVITQAPAVAQQIGVRQTVYGRITDVDRDGVIKVKTDRDSFEARVSPEVLRHVRKGDNVVIDLTINPPGAASPR